jgi:hypothetical protein
MRAKAKAAAAASWGQLKLLTSKVDL